MCDFFALLLVWHEMGDARDLWERTWRELARADLAKEIPEPTAHNNALRLVEDTLSRFNLSAASYLLAPLPDENAASATSSHDDTECKEI